MSTITAACRDGSLLRVTACPPSRPRAVSSLLRVTACPPSQLCAEQSILHVTAYPPSRPRAESVHSYVRLRVHHHGHVHSRFTTVCDSVSTIMATCRAESPACDWVSTIMATCRVGSLPKNPLGPPVHPSLPSLATTDLFTVSTVLPFPVYRGGEIPQYTAFTDCPLSLCSTHFRLFHVFSGLGSSFLFSSE